MGFLDKVKEKAAEAIEQGKDVAQGQQLKLQLEEARGRGGGGACIVRERGLHAVRGRDPLDVVRPRCGRGAHPHGTHGDRGEEGQANAAGADADGADAANGTDSASS